MMVGTRAAVRTEFLSPYPPHTHTNGDPHGDSHTHGRVQGCRGDGISIPISTPYPYQWGPADLVVARGRTSASESTHAFTERELSFYQSEGDATVRPRHGLVERIRPSSAGLMPTEARGNYFPEAPYLRETKTYLNCMHASESTLDSGTASHSSRHDMLAIISSRYQYGPFLCLLQKLCQTS